MSNEKKQRRITNILVRSVAVILAAVVLLAGCFWFYCRVINHRSFMAGFVDAFLVLQNRSKKFTYTEAADRYIAGKAGTNGQPVVIDKTKFGISIREESLDALQAFIYNDQEQPARTVFYFHGGAYINQPNNQQTTMAARTANETGAEVVLMVYPKEPVYNCEKAYELCLAYYLDYIESNDCGKIVFMGDSAGGGLALGLAEVLLQEQLPGPEELILISPWVDVSMSNPDMAEYVGHDPMLGIDGLRRMGEVWADGLPLDDPKVSPIYGELSGLCHVTLTTGTWEILYPDSMLLYEKLEDAGVDCELIVGERMILGQPGGKPFIFVIDEWDAMIREAKDDKAAQEAYLNLLRGWFKNNSFTPKVVAAAYMTGILPIKKDGSQSAISEFDEFSMLDPLDFAEYVGFTESEVRDLCSGRDIEFGTIKAWYDGYDFPSVGSVYNPYSVMNALKTGKCRSYWRKTSAAESLKYYINMDYEGLQATVARLIAGEEIRINTDGFQNDFESFESADDVLTLLVHLGYLTYHEERQTVQIPNEEIRIEFRQFLSLKRINAGWVRLIKRSQRLLDETIAGNGDAVAAALEEMRGEQYAPQFYNNEQALRAIIKYAYISAYDQYVKIEEMPSGKGVADVVFIPAMPSRLPAMVIELKWNRTPDAAVSQIRDRKYTAALGKYEGNILLVGISYDERTGKHSCTIEKA